MAQGGVKAPGAGAVPAVNGGVSWDGPTMRSVYVNACKVEGAREEITVLFGMNRGGHSGEEGVTIELADRVVMTPLVAKRFVELLQNVIEEYESKHGVLKT
jgi:hypothetical protein